MSGRDQHLSEVLAAQHPQERLDDVAGYVTTPELASTLAVRALIRELRAVAG
ncbi:MULTISPECIES: hypothetical protein [unclassified Streptomyces]|uniref:hypothetical protein n=1 Tax=unclassified Streptomyces TaxID=2593676 RepID=UPI00369B063E